MAAGGSWWQLVAAGRGQHRDGHRHAGLRLLRRRAALRAGPRAGAQRIGLKRTRCGHTSDLTMRQAQTSVESARVDVAQHGKAIQTAYRELSGALAHWHSAAPWATRCRAADADLHPVELRAKEGMAAFDAASTPKLAVPRLPVPEPVQDHLRLVAEHRQGLADAAGAAPHHRHRPGASSGQFGLLTLSTAGQRARLAATARAVPVPGCARPARR